MPECEYCGKPLKAIGTARKNGKKTHNDWESRKLHKKCWLEERKSPFARYSNEVEKKSFDYNICLQTKNNTLSDIILQKILG